MKVKKILLMENIQNIWKKNKKKQMDWILLMNLFLSKLNLNSDYMKIIKF